MFDENSYGSTETIIIASTTARNVAQIKGSGEARQTPKPHDREAKDWDWRTERSDPRINSTGIQR